MKSSWLTKGKLAAFHIFYQMVTQIFSLWFRFLSSHFSAFRCCLLLFFSSLFAFYKQFICGGSKIYFIMYAECEKNTFAENVRFFVWATQPSRRAEKHIKNMHKAPSTDKRNVRFFPAVFIVMLQVLVEYPIIRCIYTISFIRRQKIRTGIIIRYDSYKHSVIISAVFDDAIAYILSLLRAWLSASHYFCAWKIEMYWGVNGTWRSNGIIPIFRPPNSFCLDFQNIFFRNLRAWRAELLKYCRISCFPY